MTTISVDVELWTTELEDRGIEHEMFIAAQKNIDNKDLGCLE